jgi:hypothetical protein
MSVVGWGVGKRSTPFTEGVYRVLSERFSEEGVSTGFRVRRGDGLRRSKSVKSASKRLL